MSRYNPTKLRSDYYVISGEILGKVLDALEEHWFGADEYGEGYNNEEVIEADRLLRAEIASQDKV